MIADKSALLLFMALLRYSTAYMCLDGIAGGPYHNKWFKLLTCHSLYSHLRVDSDCVPDKDDGSLIIPNASQERFVGFGPNLNSLNFTKLFAISNFYFFSIKENTMRKSAPISEVPNTLGARVGTTA